MNSLKQYYLMQGIIAKIRRLCVATVVYNNLYASSRRRRREGMQHIVLNVTKFLHCGFSVACRTVQAVEVLRLKFVKDQHFYCMGGPTRSTNVRTGIPITFSTMLSMLALSEIACPLAAYGTLNNNNNNI